MLFFYKKKIAPVPVDWHKRRIGLDLSPVHTDRVDARQLICMHRMSDVSLSYTLDF